MPGKTLLQLRNGVFSLLREDATNTHFSDPTVINGFLNEGLQFAAVFIEYPRTLISVTAQQDVGSYANPTDNLLIRTAYFGDKNVAGDARPLTVISEETLKTIYPNWLDATTNSQGRPQYLIQIDRKTVHIFPRPDGANAGKKLFLNYNYVPAAMAADADTPDLPVPYHDLLPIYALHLCYIALQNVILSQAFYRDFFEKLQKLKSAVTKETKEGLGFSWGNDVNVGTSYPTVWP